VKLREHSTPINLAKLDDMKVKKVSNLLTTDQKVRRHESPLQQLKHVLSGWATAK